MYVCIHAYIHTHIHNCIRKQIYTYICAYISIYVYIHYIHRYILITRITLSLRHICIIMSVRILELSVKAIQLIKQNNISLYALTSEKKLFKYQALESVSNYRQTSNIINTEYENLNVSRLVFQLSLPNPLKLVAKCS